MFKFLNKKADKRVLSLEQYIEKLKADRDRLEDENHTLKVNVRDLKLQKKTEHEEIKHMITMKEGRMDLEFDKKQVVKDRARDEEIKKVRNQYRDKVESNLEKRGAELKEMYSEILTRLPDINVSLRGKT